MPDLNIELDDDAGVLVNGKPVEIPALRIFLGGIAVILLGFGLVFTVFADIFSVLMNVLLICVIIVLAPIWLPIHLVLRYSGRQGFVISDLGTIKLEFSANSFRKI